MINKNELMSNRTTLIQDLKSTSNEALGMFLWILGAPQSVRQAEDRFERLLGTVSSMFSKVLKSVVKLAADIIKPKGTHNSGKYILHLGTVGSIHTSRIAYGP
jgi:hypothetical protein